MQPIDTIEFVQAALDKAVKISMEQAVLVCEQNFRLYWGQKLLHTLKALHEVR